jgi:hypothetical protein
VFIKPYVVSRVFTDHPCSNPSVISISVGWAESTTRICSTSIFEVWMHASLLCRNPSCRIVHEHLLEKVQPAIVEVCTQGNRFIANPFWEGRLEVREAGFVSDTRPISLRRCTKKSKLVSIIHRKVDQRT